MLASQAIVLAVVLGVVGITWVIEFFEDKTLWISARLEMICIQVLFIAAVTVWLQRDEGADYTVLLSLLILLFALSSDAISNSSRWKALLPAAVLVWIPFVLAPRLDPPVISRVAVYVCFSCVPILAILARYLFPRTKHLIHTSLDYQLVRVEVLSMGMKRVAALGIRRNLPLPHEQTVPKS